MLGCRLLRAVALTGTLAYSDLWIRPSYAPENPDLRQAPLGKNNSRPATQPQLESIGFWLETRLLRDGGVPLGTWRARTSFTRIHRPRKPQFRFFLLVFLGAGRPPHDEC